MLDGRRYVIYVSLSVVLQFFILVVKGNFGEITERHMDPFETDEMRFRVFQDVKNVENGVVNRKGKESCKTI